MKKNLVNYDSDDEITTKQAQEKDISSQTQKKIIDYNSLPISKPINFRESLKNKLTEQDNKNESQLNVKLNSHNKGIFNLPEPKRVLENFSKSVKVIKRAEPINFIPINSNSIDTQLKNDDNFHSNESENDINENEDINNNFEEPETTKNEGNKDKILDLLNKRDKNNFKKLNIQEVNGKNLLDFDWHGYRERQKIKKETSFQKNLIAPNKMQKSKHQLTYLAYEAISKQDELDDRKNESRKNHMLTQQKYGW